MYDRLTETRPNGRFRKLEVETKVQINHKRTIDYQNLSTGGCMSRLFMTPFRRATHFGVVKAGAGPGLKGGVTPANHGTFAEKDHSLGSGAPRPAGRG